MRSKSNSSKDPRTGNWRFRKWVKLRDGTRKRLYLAVDEAGQPFTKRSDADAAGERAIERLRNPERQVMPTFDEWFNGRFWNEWVLGGPKGANKASTQESKRKIYAGYLKEFFGALPLDKIDLPLVNTFRARLRAAKLTEKTINNILTVVSKPLNYAADVRVIDRAPKVGMSETQRPQPKFYEFEEWAALLRATESADERVATLLAGDHGLRIGEVRALRMREDVDMKARKITINQAVYEVTQPDKTIVDVFDTPKGRTRRTIDMSNNLYAVLRNRLPVGYVVVGTKDGPDGKYMSHGEGRWMMERLSRRAGLTAINKYGAWHILRHTFATHAALLNANVWTLNQWMGHKTLEETLMYVSLAKARAREIPAIVLAAGEGIADPDKRLREQLDARAAVAAVEKKKTRKR
jgi:integrase